MIQLYTGVPGAGKSYKMVEDLDAFLTKEPGINLISNIRGLKLPHVDFDDFLLECIPDKGLEMKERIERFFEYDYQKALNDKFGGPLMYVLDECQLYFKKDFKLPNTEAYLQRHRHLGHYLYLATQSSTLINRNIVHLVEIEYYAVRRSISLFGEIHYRVKSPQSNQFISKFTVRPKKRIFELYKSFEAKEITKPKRDIWKKMWPLLILIAGGIFFYNHFLNIDRKVERMTGRSASQGATPDGPSQPQPVNSATREELARLQFEIDELQKRFQETERVFLTVIETGGKRLTVDPETDAVVDVRALVERNVRCVNGGLTCYYDRPFGTGVKMAEPMIQRPVISTVFYQSAPTVNVPGPGSFVDASMVPPPAPK